MTSAIPPPKLVTGGDCLVWSTIATDLKMYSCFVRRAILEMNEL